MKNFYLATIVLIAAMLLTLPATAQANLLNNPGFEANSGAGTVPDWWSKEAGSWAGVEGWAAHTDSWGYATYPMSWGSPGTNYLLQDVSGIVGGASYNYSIWTLRDGGDSTGTYYMKVGWYDNTNALLSEVSQNITLDPATWGQQNFSGLVAPGSAVQAKVGFGTVTASLAGKWDDADFSPIPEPASMLLLGSGLFGLLVLNKNRSSK